MSFSIKPSKKQTTKKHRGTTKPPVCDESKRKSRSRSSSPPPIVHQTAKQFTDLIKKDRAAVAALDAKEKEASLRQMSADYYHQEALKELEEMTRRREEAEAVAEAARKREAEAAREAEQYRRHLEQERINLERIRKMKQMSEDKARLRRT